MGTDHSRIPVRFWHKKHKKGNLAFPVILMMLIIGTTATLLELIVSLKSLEIRENDKMDEIYLDYSINEVAAAQIVADLHGTFVDEIDVVALREDMYNVVQLYFPEYDRNVLSIDYSSVMDAISDPGAGIKPSIEVWYKNNICDITNIKLERLVTPDPDEPEIEIPGVGMRPNLIIRHRFDLSESKIKRMIETP